MSRADKFHSLPLAQHTLSSGRQFRILEIMDVDHNLLLRKTLYEAGESAGRGEVEKAAKRHLLHPDGKMRESGIHFGNATGHNTDVMPLLSKFSAEVKGIAFAATPGGATYKMDNPHLFMYFASDMERATDGFYRSAKIVIIF